MTEEVLKNLRNGRTSMAKHKFKMISINYTNECAKKPRCSFCYLKKAELYDRLVNPEHPVMYNDAFMPSELYKWLELTEQISIAFNGLGIAFLNNLLSSCHTMVKEKRLIVNITTNPEFLVQQIVALFKRWKVTMVALSLDPEKCSVDLWLEKAKLLKKYGIKVGANILMLDEVYPETSKILERIHKLCYQIHLLRPKFYKTKISLGKRKELIWLLKQKYKNLFIDECFKWEFTGEPCSRGKDFISINANGKVSLCSFDIYGDGKLGEQLKQCPFI